MKNIKKDFEAFHDFLEKDSERRQTMSIEEFTKYENLFRHNKKSEDLKDLSEKFFLRIDPYLPVKIMDGDEILFTLPPIFFPLKTLSSKNKDSMQKFYNLINSDLPRIRSEGVQEYLKTLAKNQLTKDNKDMISQYKKIYLEGINSIKKLYKNKNKDNDNNLTKTFIKDIENIDGIGWD